MKAIRLLFFLGLVLFVWRMYSHSPAGGMVTGAIAAEIEIYTASYCSECKRAKNYMKSKGIVFSEYDIEKDIDKRREFYARGGKVIPLVFVRGEAMHGFDAQRFEAMCKASVSRSG